MAVGRREPQLTREGADEPLAALAAAALELARGVDVGTALRAIVAAAARATGADLALVRVLERENGQLATQAVHSDSPALAAELEGVRAEADELALDEAAIPPSLRAAAERVGATAVLAEPIRAGRDVLGSLELLRAGAPFDDHERLLARLAAAQAAAAIRACPPLPGAVARNGAGTRSPLELAGEALAAGSDEARAAEELARVAQAATGAAGAALFRVGQRDALELLAAFGAAGAAADAVRATLAREPVAAGGPLVLPIDDPPAWALALVPRPGRALAAEPEALDAFAARAAQALRASERVRALTGELERTSALLDVVAGANAELSLSRTVEHVVERISELLDVDRVAVYLREDERLRSVAELGLEGRHDAIAERLLELALRARSRGPVVVSDAAWDTRLAGLADALAETRIETALAVPLLVPGGVTGLLALYPGQGRSFGEGETVLVSALAAQLAISVQNATLHEQATDLGARLELVLAQEREQARELGALYEISSSFTESLSLEHTLSAVARTVVDLLEVDAAVIHLPDARGEVLVPRARHVADGRLDGAVAGVLERPHPLEGLTGRRLLRQGKPLVLDPELVAASDSGFHVLLPFLEAGSTSVVLPLATQTELLGLLTLLSLDPARPVTEATTRIALPVAKQAALAIDNARLYQHQKEFSDTMARSLLPRTQPALPGLEVGDVYESSARVEVGGDVYDFLTLDDGRLAVVLGDVTGHGVEAAADMAMAKFVFRSLARDHPEPAEFLAAANEVVCDEIASGKFITMLYLTVDGVRGELACAGAGHPSPRLLLPDGTVRSLAVRGLALGIETGQAYDELRETVPPGACVVVYTDGVVEARRGGELFGAERLDRVLAENRDLSAEELAHAVLAECRAFSRGELTDDCAVVVIRRLPA